MRYFKWKENAEIFTTQNTINDHQPLYITKSNYIMGFNFKYIRMKLEQYSHDNILRNGKIKPTYPLYSSFFYSLGNKITVTVAFFYSSKIAQVPSKIRISKTNNSCFRILKP